jgi:hypothetical protein
MSNVETSCCFCFSSSPNKKNKNAKQKGIKKSKGAENQFENNNNELMLSNATIEENSLIKSNLTGTRLLMDSRFIFLLRFF